MWLEYKKIKYICFSKIEKEATKIYLTDQNNSILFSK
mgnify:CR=1 FL=1